MSSQQGEPALKASEATAPGRFDRFATMVASTVARSWFFFTCVMTLIVWVPSYYLFGNVDTWQLIINTWTTCITFLLVALLQNTQSRDTKSIQRKLNALLEGMADLMQAHEAIDHTMQSDLDELQAAVGLEHREGS